MQMTYSDANHVLRSDYRYEQVISVLDREAREGLFLDHLSDVRRFE